ncbi:hypothetical protein ACXR2T_10080 [Leucobacter sp. HY1910]
MPRALTRITAAALAVGAAFTLSSCAAPTPGQLAFQACKQYVELGEASNDNVSSYCMESSEGSGEVAGQENIDAIRQLIVEYNQDNMGNPDKPQIKVGF